MTSSEETTAPATDEGATSEPTRPLPRWRRVLFSLLPLLALLVVVELVAWGVDAGTNYRTRLLDRLALLEVHNQPIEGDVRLDWPAGTVGVREPDQPTKTKFVPPEHIVHDGERRVFVVGASAAFGYPHAYDDSFGALLNVRMRGQGVRVVTAAKAGLSSGRLVSVVRRIVDDYEPDTLVLYSGNNEWIQWVPANQPSAGASRVRLMRLLAHSRALAGLEYWLLATAPREAPADPDGYSRHFELVGWRHAVAHPAAPDFDALQWLDSKERFLDVFEENLERMIRTARGGDVRVVLLTVPFGHRLSPSWSHPQPRWFEPDDREALTAAHLEAADLVERGRFREALVTIESGLAIDPRPPVLNYLKGWCLSESGDPLAAEEAFAQCREHMVGNLGGRLSINRSIRDVAERTGVELLDVAALFESVSRKHRRFFNASLMHDDCHPSLAGHQLIARALADLLR